jgi:hypothetical protein
MPHRQRALIRMTGLVASLSAASMASAQESPGVPDSDTADIPTAPVEDRRAAAVLDRILQAGRDPKRDPAHLRVVDADHLEPASTGFAAGRARKPSNYVADTPEPRVVPTEQWHAAPAQRPDPAPLARALSAAAPSK